jgi:hypothetical protein
MTLCEQHSYKVMTSVLPSWCVVVEFSLQSHIYVQTAPQSSFGFWVLPFLCTDMLSDLSSLELHHHY